MVNSGAGSDKILGIDLGTTNSAFAVMEGGDPEMIVNSEGDRTTPSVVAFSEGERLVGKPAKNQAVQHPNGTVESIKRHMGEDDYTVKLEGESYTPEQVSAMILQKIKRDAEEYLGDEIEKAVITVPAHFSDRQRQATRDAGEVAGFEVERIINEPAAASMAYGLDDESDQTVLVFDLGGGSFSISILDLGGGVYEVVATNGDNTLGGDDWDRAVIDWLAEDFHADHGIDLREDCQALQRLTEAAEEAKVELSNRKETTITLPFIAADDAGPKDLEASFTRAKFESLTSELVERTVGPTEQALEDAGYAKGDIDEVILVGGSTRMPMIQEKVAELTGQEQKKNVNPDEAVALGAAIQGGVLSGDVDDIVLLDVTPLSLGVEVKGGLFERLIEKNTTIPTEESKIFTTAQANQARVSIRVFQGEREIAEENELLEERFVSEVPPKPAGEAQVVVTYEYDESDDLDVTVNADPDETDLMTGGEYLDTGGILLPPESAERTGSQADTFGSETSAYAERSKESSDVAPAASETLVEEVLSIRNVVHRGRLYCRESPEHMIADIRDNLEKATSEITTVLESQPEETTDDSEAETKIERQRTHLRDRLTGVGETLDRLASGRASQRWTVDDLDSLVSTIDEALETAGLTLIDPDRGSEVDPYRHVVLYSTESAVPEGRIVLIQAVGYERGGEAYREAKVVASSGDATETIERGDSLRTDAVRYREASKYDRALDACNEATALYEDALEAATEDPFIDTGEIEQKLAAVREEREAVHRQQLQEDVASLRADLDQTSTLVQEGSLEEAVEQLDDLESRLTAAEERATRHGFDDLSEEITALLRRREELHEEAAERPGEHPIPDEIPDVPDVSVEYDALTDEEPIGGGGNADVSKATLPDPAGAVTLAIKRPRMAGTLHRDTVERMLAEAETWDKLDDHDHIVGVVDYGSEPFPWIAMEHMDGGHLGDRSGEMELPQALWTAVAVTRGVRHAHRRGVAHLDLKPENVLLGTVEEGWDVPKVADWGLSKHLLRHSRSVEGFSPQYAALEQFDDEYGPADDITDVYQLGAVFYELFTGQSPFDGGPARVMNQVLNESPVPPSETADVPADLDEVLSTALAKEKADRYDDIVYLRDELQAVLDDW